jgi:hypothetical protein
MAYFFTSTGQCMQLLIDRKIMAKQREFRISIVALIRILKSKLKVMPWHNELNLVKRTRHKKASLIFLRQVKYHEHNPQTSIKNSSTLIINLLNSREINACTILASKPLHNILFPSRSVKSTPVSSNRPSGVN